MFVLNLYLNAFYGIFIYGKYGYGCGKYSILDQIFKNTKKMFISVRYRNFFLFLSIPHDYFSSAQHRKGCLRQDSGFGD